MVSNSSSMRRMGAVLIALGCVAASRPALAQTPAQAAHQHFDRGYALAQSGAFEAAIQEFEQAYAASPNPSVLFNLGQAYGASGRAVEASRTLSRYLEQAGDGIDGEQRERTQQLLAYYEQRIGRVELERLPDGAQVTLDGEAVGLTPLTAPLRATSGKHALLVEKPGFLAEHRVVTVLPGQATKLAVALRPQPQSPTCAVAPAAPPDDHVGRLVRQQQERREKQQKLAAYAFGAGALLTGGSAVVLALINDGRYDDWRQRNEAFVSAFQRDPGSTNPSELESLLTEENSIRNRDALALGLGVGAGALAITSIALYFTASQSLPTLSISPQGQASLGYRMVF